MAGRRRLGRLLLRRHRGCSPADLSNEALRGTDTAAVGSVEHGGDSDGGQDIRAGVDDCTCHAVIGNPQSHVFRKDGCRKVAVHGLDAGHRGSSHACAESGNGSMLYRNLSQDTRTGARSNGS